MRVGKWQWGHCITSVETCTLYCHSSACGTTMDEPHPGSDSVLGANPGSRGNDCQTLRVFVIWFLSVCTLSSFVAWCMLKIENSDSSLFCIVRCYSIKLSISVFKSGATICISVSYSKFWGSRSCVRRDLRAWIWRLQTSGCVDVCVWQRSLSRRSRQWRMRALTGRRLCQSPLNVTVARSTVVCWSSSRRCVPHCCRPRRPCC